MAVRFMRAHARAILLAALAASILLAGVLFLRAPATPIVAPIAGGPTAPTPPPPPPPWTRDQLRDLLVAVDGAAAEGLRSEDYHAAALHETAEAGRTGAETDALADRAAAALAHDYAAGHIRNRHRFNWYIDYAGPNAAEFARLVIAARQDGRLATWLAGLLPADRQYRALRAALAATPEDDDRRRDRIKANMERRRWLPRDIDEGDRLYVNLPTYRLEVRHGDETVASYRAVIGATDMPTPVLEAPVRQVIANPDWIVPQSIVRKSHLRPGASSKYVFSTRPDGTLRVRQKPGTGNALGKVKIEFPNKLAIYFHDTPSRSLFGAETRAFSHGCVRVQNIAELAGTLVPRRDRYDAAMAGTQTRSLPVTHPWRATIVYLTMVRDADGGIVDVGDPYGMDEAMAAALAHRKPRSPIAAVPVTPAKPAGPTPPVAPAIVPVVPLDLPAPALGNDAG